MSTVPASLFVKVTPEVLSAGGDQLDIIGLMLTNSTRPPIGTVPAFGSLASVQAYFGDGSAEAAQALIYFKGFNGSDALPGSLLFAQYNEADVAAYLRGGNISGLTVLQIQALNGALSVTMDGYVRSGGTVNLSSATSFSSAAGIIQTAVNGSLATLATFTASITTTAMTVTAVGSGTISVGQTVMGATVTAGTTILAQVSGTSGGDGVYTVSHSQSVMSESMTTQPTPVAVTYDSTSGAFIVTSGITGTASLAGFATGTLAPEIELTAATGAVVSNGAIAAVPSTFMTAVTNVTQNWATFMTIFDPDNGSGNVTKLLFSAWADSTDDRYGYVAWDPDTVPASNGADASCLPALIAAAGYSGTFSIWTAAPDKASFVLAIGASIDFEKTNGRTDYDYRSQDGLLADVTDVVTYDNLIANGYNVYAAVATANQGFVFLTPGSVSGPFEWMDSYVNQIWLNNNFQLSGMELLVNAKSIPYNAAGYAQIEAAFADPINAGLNFGAFRAGVPLSASQIQDVNSAAGVVIAPTLATRGWYLQIVPASATIRQQRKSPTITFWYVDGGSVQQIDLTSILVQ